MSINEEVTKKDVYSNPGSVMLKTVASSDVFALNLDISLLSRPASLWLSTCYYLL